MTNYGQLEYSYSPQPYMSGYAHLHEPNHANYLFSIAKVVDVRPLHLSWRSQLAYCGKGKTYHGREVFYLDPFHY